MIVSGLNICLAASLAKPSSIALLENPDTTRNYDNGLKFSPKKPKLRNCFMM